MIKITKAEWAGDHRIRLRFSDGSIAECDFSYLLKKGTVLTEPLKDPEYFKSFFLELGALGWKNGLELSPESLYHRALASGILQKPEQVA